MLYTKLGEHVILSCTAIGGNDLTISWYYAENIEAETLKVQIYEESEALSDVTSKVVSTLNIRNAEMRHDGLWTCKSSESTPSRTIQQLITLDIFGNKSFF